MESIGDLNGIVSGSTRITTGTVRLRIASDTAKFVDAVGNTKKGMSFQTGASGTSLAVAAEVRDMMRVRGVTGSFGLGGIHAYLIQMLEEGLFNVLHLPTWMTLNPPPETVSRCALSDVC